MSNDSPPDDLPSLLTQLLRNTDGVHTVYATKPIVATIVTAVVELVKNEPVGVHLVSVTEDDDGTTHIDASIGVTAHESAIDVTRRAHDAIRDFLADTPDKLVGTITVKVGRVG